MRFIVESSFNQAPTPEIIALIPAESARGLELDAQGIRKALYLASDQSRAWQIFESDSREAVEAAVASFPLHPFLNIVITELADNSAG